MDERFGRTFVYTIFLPTTGTTALIHDDVIIIYGDGKD